MFFIKNPFKNQDMRAYFDTLPAIVKESIAQSGMQFESVGALRAFVENLTTKE